METPQISSKNILCPNSLLSDPKVSPKISSQICKNLKDKFVYSLSELSLCPSVVTTLFLFLLILSSSLIVVFPFSLEKKKTFILSNKTLTFVQPKSNSKFAKSHDLWSIPPFTTNRISFLLKVADDYPKLPIVLLQASTCKNCTAPQKRKNSLLKKLKPKYSPNQVHVWPKVRKTLPVPVQSFYRSSKQKFTKALNFEGKNFLETKLLAKGLK